MNNYKYIYGPVPSWRLGRSLGIDLLSQKNKICNFSCVYCKLGDTLKYVNKRKIYVPTKNIIAELKRLPKVRIDYIAFSGRGEPTLAANLGEAIKAVKKIRPEPIAVITNSALIDREDVQNELAYADFVVAKLDADSQQSLEKINRPAPTIKYNNIINGLIHFRKIYNKKLALQIMLINQNKEKIKKLIDSVKQIEPDEVQLNTPLRKCAIKPLPKDSILEIKRHFIKKLIKININIISVYDAVKHIDVVSISDADTLKRRGKNKD